MRSFAGIGLFAAALLAAAQARADVTLGPGETLTWATDAPASGEAITATGGTIVFDANATASGPRPSRSTTTWALHLII